MRRTTQSHSHPSILHARRWTEGSTPGCMYLLLSFHAHDNSFAFDASTKAVGFNQSSDFPTFNFTVTDDSKPIWGYCRQAPPPPGPTHCQSGMVFAINPPSYGNTFEKFLTTAKASHEQSQPLTHYVTVGGVKSDGTPNLAYDPPIVKASPGDKVHFIL